jgi:hypothetical protein
VLRSRTAPDGPRVFDSPGARDVWQRQQYGAIRNGFREEHEATDDRPLLVYPEPFWESHEEMAAWMRAVRACPLSAYGHLDLFAYLGEVAKFAVGLPGGLRKVARGGMTRRQMDERLRLLHGQADAVLEEPKP